MTVKVETTEGSLVVIQSNEARSIIEQLMTLCENMEHMTDSEIVADLGNISTVLQYKELI